MDSSSSSEIDSKNQSSSILSTPPRNVASSSLATSSTTLTIPLDSMDLSNTSTTAGNNLLFSSASKATPMTPTTPSSSHPVKTLYLSNLPQDVKEREMYLLCRSLDGYDGFVLKPPPSSHHGMSAFIAFTSAELAQVGYMKLHDFIKDEACPVEWKQVKIDFAKSDTRHHSHHPSHHQQQSSSKRARSVDMYTSSPYNGNSYYYGANTSTDSVSSQPSSPNHSFSASNTVTVNTSQTSGGSPRHQQQHSPPHQPISASQQQQQQPPSTPPQSMKSEKRIKYNNYYASPSGQANNHAWNESQNENSSNFDNNQMLLNTLLSIYNTQQTQQPSQQSNTASNNNNNNNQLLVNLMSLVSNQLSSNNNNNSAPSTPSGSATSTPFKSSTARDVSVGSNHGALFSPTTTSQAATVLFSPNAPTTSQNTSNNFQHLRVVTSSTSTPMRQTVSTNTGTNANEASGNSNSANVLHSFQSSTPSTPHHSHAAHMGLGSVSTPSNTHSGFNVLTPSSNLSAQNTLFVANLPQECTDLDLHGFFSQFYGFVRCKRGHKPFLCFVEFQDSFSAQQAKEVLHHFHLRYVLYNSPNANSPMIHFLSIPTIANKNIIQQEDGDDDGLSQAQQQPQSLDDKGTGDELFEKEKALEKVLRCEFAKNRMK